jgi:hypothetical protein
MLIVVLLVGSQMLPEGIEGAMRPGCLHLSLDFWMRSVRDCEAAVCAFMRHLASPSNGSRLPWLTHDTWIHMPDAIIQVTKVFRGEGQ